LDKRFQAYYQEKEELLRYITEIGADILEFNMTDGESAMLEKIQQYFFENYNYLTYLHLSEDNDKARIAKGLKEEEERQAKRQKNE